MRSLHYEQLDPQISAAIFANEESTLSPYAFRSFNALRRSSEHDLPNAIRPPFIRDIDKIMHCPFFNRYADKTQVFSFYHNDDITRRSLHVQLVSRIGRTIGRALGLNLELIEAIALGHDIGHPPFAHTGETFLNELTKAETGRSFHHNIHSVRVLDRIFPYNVTLQTLDGIAGHDGENEVSLYMPAVLSDFDRFDEQMELAVTDEKALKGLMPGTLEGCVVRISDIIAYLGKDRQDAIRAKQISEEDFEDNVLGITNAELLNNTMVNVIENSFGKPYIAMDKEHFEALKTVKKENYEKIYLNPKKDAFMKENIKPMMEDLYFRFRKDVQERNTASPIFRHHIKLVNGAHYERPFPYEETDSDQLVTDYIASMTDDYFVDTYNYVFPEKKNIPYINYYGE